MRIIFILLISLCFVGCMSSYEPPMEVKYKDQFYSAKDRGREMALDLYLSIKKDSPSLKQDVEDIENAIYSYCKLIKNPYLMSCVEGLNVYNYESFDRVNWLVVGHSNYDIDKNALVMNGAEEQALSLIRHKLMTIPFTKDRYVDRELLKTFVISMHDVFYAIKKEKLK